jgi:hypothetical protein
MRTAALPVESKKVNEKATKTPLDKTDTPEITVNPMVKTQSKIRQTFNEYVGAQKDFENAFKERERRDQEAFKEAEKRYRAYEDALETAFNIRESSEQKALESYQNTVNDTRTIYANTMKRALVDCRNSTEQARSILLGISAKEEFSNSPVWFTLRVNKPNWESVKRGIHNSTSWMKEKKDYLLEKAQRHSKTEVINTPVEQ